MKILNAIDAAIMLDMCPATIKAKARAGAIPSAKSGKKWLFVDVDLIDYLRSQ